MSADKALNFEALQELTGYKRAADIERCLKPQGVLLLRGKDGRPFTTTAAINQAMGIREATTQKAEGLDFKFDEAG